MCRRSQSDGSPAASLWVRRSSPPQPKALLALFSSGLAPVLFFSLALLLA